MGGSARQGASVLKFKALGAGMTTRRAGNVEKGLCRPCQPSSHEQTPLSFGVPWPEHVVLGLFWGERWHSHHAAEAQTSPRHRRVLG